jgi:hypothetical protein
MLAGYMSGKLFCVVYNFRAATIWTLERHAPQFQMLQAQMSRLAVDAPKLRSLVATHGVIGPSAEGTA